MRRKILLAVLAAVSGLSVAESTVPASAGTIQDTYCLQGRRSGYPGNCQFSTYEQCLATASGTADGCGINPMRAFAQQPRSGRRNRY